MSDKVLVFYGSYRSDGMGVRLADYVVAGLKERGADADMVDAKVVDLPMLDRMYKEYPKGAAPAPMEALAEKIRNADAVVFVTGEYNCGPQPGLKNLTDHFLEEWFWRPAAIASYSAGRFSGVRSGTVWHSILSEIAAWWWRRAPAPLLGRSPRSGAGWCCRTAPLRTPGRPG